MLCAMMWTRLAPGPTRWKEQVFEVVAGEYRAVAVIGIVEQSRFGRPGEGHRPAAELNCIGEMRGIEHGCLERLFEAVHVDQDVASAAGLRETADFSGHGSTPSIRQSAGPTAASDRRLSPGGTSFARATIIVKPAPARTGLRVPAVHGLRVVGRNIGSSG